MVVTVSLHDTSNGVSPFAKVTSVTLCKTLKVGRLGLSGVTSNFYRYLHISYRLDYITKWHLDPCSGLATIDVGRLVAWSNVSPWPACFRCPALGLQLMGDHLCGKPSATGQPTRLTQPFILLRSINE